MVLQQMVNTDYENVPQHDTPVIIRKVKKSKPSTLIIEDYVSDSSTDSLTVEASNFVENVPVQRPKRCKAQRLNTNKNSDTNTLNQH